MGAGVAQGPHLSTPRLGPGFTLTLSYAAASSGVSLSHLAF